MVIQELYPKLQRQVPEVNFRDKHTNGKIRLKWIKKKTGCADVDWFL
jgi:hypothetical protein